jgi:hypothetical protein
VLQIIKERTSQPFGVGLFVYKEAFMKQPKTPAQIQGPELITDRPDKYQVKVDPNSSVSAPSQDSEWSEKVPVDLNYAFVPTELTQKDKESPDNLQKTLDTTMERFGLKY